MNDVDRIARALYMASQEGKVSLVVIEAYASDDDITAFIEELRRELKSYAIKLPEIEVKKSGDYIMVCSSCGATWMYGDRCPTCGGEGVPSKRFLLKSIVFY